LAGQPFWFTSRSIKAAAMATALLAPGATGPVSKPGSSSILFTQSAPTG
jgi:hypothetical protein